ncbi:5'-nucleotidase SurE, partial [Frankliniella fusca]
MAYVLVFWEDTASTSIVHKSKIIGGVVAGAKRDVVWGKKQLPAKIIRAGTAPALKEVVITIDGQVSDPARGPQGELAKRRSEIIDERQRAAVQRRTAAEAVRRHALYNITADDPDDHDAGDGVRREEGDFLFDANASAEDMLKTIPVPLTRVNIKALLLNLPCLREPPAGDDKICNLGGTLYPVYVEKRAAWSLTKAHKGDSCRLFRELVLLCVPPAVLALPYVSAGGTRGTIGVPRTIWKGVAFYIGAKTDGAITDACKSMLNLIRTAKADGAVQGALRKHLQRPN